MQNHKHISKHDKDFTVKNVKKEFLPQRICVVCKKPFSWRKKWEKVWDEVKYCSDKCRMNKKKVTNQEIRNDGGKVWYTGDKIK